MSSVLRSARKWGVVFVAVASVIAGARIVWDVVQPGVLHAVPTTALLVLAGLFILPGLTMIAWDLDRRAAAHAPASASSQHSADPSA